MLLNNGLINTPMPLLPNPLAQPVPTIPGMPQTRSLALNQIEGFEPVQEFKDDSNTPWRLVKAASNSTVDVPDPKSAQIVDFWNHDFPGLKTKLYVYVVEAIKQPRVETEQPTRLMYQWFSTEFVPSFTPAMISEKEWLKANVYAAPLTNSRVSKLNAICKIQGNGAPANTQADDNKLIHVEGLSDGSAAQGTEAQN